MSEAISLISTLRRPKLLLRAAQFGLADYNRSYALKRLTTQAAVPTPKVAVEVLLSAEERLEAKRVERDASYVPSRHVEVLIALLAEAASLMRSTRPRPA